MWRRTRTHRFERTTLIFLLALCFVLGIALAHNHLTIDASWLWLLGLVVLWTIKGRRLWCVIWIVMLGLGFGCWRGSAYMTKLADYQTLAGQRVTLIGRAANDAVYDQKKQLSFDVRNAEVEKTGQKLTGKIGVSGFGLNAVFAGDEVRMTAKLNPSRGGSYQAYMSYGQLELVAHHPTLVTQLRSKFVAGLQSALPEPLASFGLGLLVGQRNTLPPEVSQTLLMVGLTHIIAVSGYNLTILLRASKHVLGKRSKRQATIVSLLLIGMFLLFAGQSASIIRAAIVSMLSIAAAYYGRQFKPVVLIMMAAAITAYMNPFHIWTDVSWYLSFLAFYGVMVLAPLVMRRLPKRLHESLVANVALESLCAEAMTLPYVLHIFGQMSLIGQVSNVLVVALIPLAMLLSLLAGIAGMIVPAFAGWFAWPAVVLLTYMLDVATMLSRIPHVFLQNLVLSLQQLLFLYGIVAGTVYVLYRKSRLKYVTITDRNDDEAEGTKR